MIWPLRLHPWAGNSSHLGGPNHRKPALDAPFGLARLALPCRWFVKTGKREGNADLFEYLSPLAVTTGHQNKWRPVERASECHVF